MDNNPYQAPPISSEPLATASPFAPQIRSFVDGDALIVASGSVLPEICIKTNQPVLSADMKKQVTTWCPPWVIAILFLLGPLIMIIVYLAARKKCVLTLGLHPDIRKRYRNRLLIKSAIAFALFMVMLFSTAITSSEVTFALLILFLIALIVAFVGNSPISIKKYRDGAFWVKGCSQEFLTGLLE